MDEDANDDDDGRTVVRGAPKIVKRSAKSSLSQPPTSISPAAVIKATLESARANRREQLMPGPPSDLLEDSSDFSESARDGRTPFMGLQQHTAPVFDRGPAVFDRTGAPFEGPPSHRPPASYAPPPSSHGGGGYGHHSAVPSAPPSYAQHGGHYSGAPSAAPSVPGVAPSMPAHFMTPQAPYGNNDPPATAVTSGHKVSGRPAISWAAALLACGLFVGVGAVAVLQSSESVADTTASFVDPSRASKAQHAPATQPQTPVPVAAPNAAAAPNAPPANAPADPNAAPPGLLGASPVAPQPPPVAAPAPAPDPNVAVAPVVTTPPAQPGVAFAPVAVPPATPSAANRASPPPAPRPTFAWKPAPPPAAAPAPKPAPKPAPAAAAPAADDEPAPKKTAAKASKGSSKGSSSDTDDETKKALEALQKAQLESASSFGEK